MMGRQFCTAFDRNVQYWMRNVKLQKSMSDRWPKESLHQVYLWKRMCRMKVSMIHCAFLQHNCSRSLPLIFTSTSPCWPITPLHTIASFLTCASQQPTMIVDLLALFRWETKLISPRNYGYRALEFGSYTCIDHRELSDNFNINVHIVLPGWSIHQNNLPAGKYSKPSLDMPFWLNALQR